MDRLVATAAPALEKLLVAEETQLYEQLGIRSLAIAADPTVAGSFEPDVVYQPAEMGLKDDVRELGQRLYRRWNAEAYALVCGSDEGETADRKSLLEAFGVNEVVVAATLSGMLVVQIGLSPAIAAVIAAIVIRRFFRPGYEEFCKVWERSLPQPDGGTPGSPTRAT